MGRYYTGDINGKFWFGVQSSDDASFFGGDECEPNYIEYYFGAEEKDTIDYGIRRCLDALGSFKPKLDSYFAANNGYNDRELAHALGIPEDELWRLLEWYARLELGEKIQKCVAEKGECQFEAEF